MEVVASIRSVVDQLKVIRVCCSMVKGSESKTFLADEKRLSQQSILSRLRRPAQRVFGWAVEGVPLAVASRVV